MNREEALKFLEEKLSNKNVVKHCLALEAVMRAFAEYFKEDPEKWRLAGLLHDLDYEQNSNSPENHTLETAKILEEKGVEHEIIDIIKAHNGALHFSRDTKVKKVIFSADTLTGLIIACALVLPNKKLSSLSVKSILKKFKNKNFAAGTRRDEIQKCEELGMSLEKFIEISLKAMQGISEELGL